MSEQTPDFRGQRVAAFESRRADEMARLIKRYGGVPHVSPALRETPADDPRSAVDFAYRLVTGEVDVVVFLTDVGFRGLWAIVQRHLDGQRYLDALSDITTVASGSKTVAAMREVGLTPTLCTPAPSTWRQVLQTIDGGLPVANKVVALQESGQPNTSLTAGLEARGARVLRVQVYGWDLPTDLGPLTQNIRDLAEGRLDVLLFTAAPQVVNLLRVADDLGLTDRIRQRLAATAVASLGPVTRETLRDHGIRVDIQPESSELESLVRAAARECHAVSSRRSRIAAIGSAADPASATARQIPSDSHAPWYDSPFLKACRREPVEYTPVWLMRQAGRYMAEYREVRAKTSFLQLCKSPSLCSEVMCTAVARLGVDAAIIFSDLLPILEPMGLDLEFTAGEGPVIHNPVRAAADVDRVRELDDLGSLDFVFETVRQTRGDLPSQIPVIGFAGAPFTLASYLIEGGSSRSYLHTKALMYRDAGAWNELMQRLARGGIRYLNAQIGAGAQCVQLFDSWVGCLGPDDYRRYVLPHVRQIIAGILPDVPVIYFAAGNPALIPLAAEAGSSVVGVDWRIGLRDAWGRVGPDRAIQGNLDPAVLLADRAEIRRRVKELLDQAANRPGHIFNLGHGVLPQTPVDNAIALVDAVHELSRR